jgi:hypothetical protein
VWWLGGSVWHLAWFGVWGRKVGERKDKEAHKRVENVSHRVYRDRTSLGCRWIGLRTYEVGLCKDWQIWCVPL